MDISSIDATKRASSTQVRLLWQRQIID